MTIAQTDFDNFAPIVREWQDAGLFFITRHTRKYGILVLAKKEPFLFGGCVYEPGKMWFEYAPTEELAVAALKKEIPD